MADRKDSKSGWGVLIAAVLTVVILWSLNWILLLKFGGNEAEKGQFGDMFGSVNALFSGLAFAFLIYTIWLQREELKLQREELKLQREALQLQAEELKRQADELAKTSMLQEESIELQKLIRKESLEEKERQSQAVFIQHGDFQWQSHGSEEILMLRLTNSGSIAANVKVTCSENLYELRHEHIQKDYKDERMPNVKLNEVISLRWKYSIKNVPNAIDVQIKYTDKLGANRTQSLQVINDNKASNITEKYKVIYK